MTLAFVTTIRHPQNASSYADVEALLHDTVASMIRQTSTDYVVVIVGNQRPSFRLSERTHFVEVNFPAPSTKRSAQTGLGPSIWDKGTKVCAGLVAARDLGADYVMLVDADDFVHRDLASFVQDNPEHPGWVLKRGWTYSRARNAYALRRNLFRVCGTSFILPLEAYDIPSTLHTGSPQHVFAEAFGEQLEDVLGNHRYALEWWRARGRELSPLPFAGAVYHVDTGENHSGGGLLGPGLPHREHLEIDFGIRPTKGRAASLWSALGPLALKPDLRPRRPFFIRTRRGLTREFRPPAT